MKSNRRGTTGRGRPARRTRARLPTRPEAAASTRERLLGAAIRLFAEKGFAGTTVGDIEGAAGLTPRGGGFYRHFRSKQDVLGSGVDAHIALANHTRAALDLLPFGDLRSELTLVCRWLLESIDQQREVLQVVEREAERFPKLRDKWRAELLETLHLAAVGFTRRWSEKTGHPSRDPEASAVIMVGAAVNYRRVQWTFGEAPLGVSDERFVETWVHYCHDLMTGTST
jgi:AcrR family transcriptional regulator